MNITLHVLIVEDSEDDALLIVQALERSGYCPVYERVDTRDAMAAALQRRRWEVIISDYAMPHFSGLDAIMLSVHSGLDIPVILVSGAIGEETAVAAMQAGAADYVMKDNLARLGAAVDRELREAEQRRQRREAEEALRFTQFTVDHTSEAILWFRPNLGILDANNAACRMLGYSRDELRNMSIRDIDCGGCAGDASSHWKRMCEQGVSSVESVHRTRDGRSIPVAVTCNHLLTNGREYGAMFIRDITRQKRSEEMLRSQAAHMEKIREDERAEVARDIHDNLAQLLTALRIDLTQLALRVAGDAEAAERTRVMGDLINQAVGSVHEVSMKLRPVMLDDLGLAAATEWHVKEFEKRTGISSSLVIVPKDGFDLDTNRATALFRILQEALTNVARHAKASVVKIRLECAGNGVTLTVADNGRGITQEQMDGVHAFGLIGMRERVVALDGKFHIQGEQGRGTTVTGWIPLQGSTVQAGPESKKE